MRQAVVHEGSGTTLGNYLGHRRQARKVGRETDAFHINAKLIVARTILLDDSAVTAG
ncbi:hypothetical protein D3C74_486780 [compost metagenome]